jgi:glycerophosphoryl diester phosphodiesterase
MLNRYVTAAFAFALLIVGGTALAGVGSQWGYNAYHIMSTIRARHPDLVMLAAHRGIHALYNGYDFQNVPENSLESIYNAANQGIEIVELDVRLTQDGVPILSHDSTWGRETNVGNAWGQCCFNPWGPLPGLSVPDGDPGELGGGVNSPSDPQKAVNPNVSDWSRASVQDGPTHLTLRTSTNFAWSSWYESPPTLQQALDYIRNNQMNIVISLDIKDASALQAAWYVVATNKDFNGNSYYQTTFFKFDAAWVYPRLSDFIAAFSNTWWAGGYWFSDAFYLNIMPVFQTSGIAPNLYGSELGEQQAMATYAQSKMTNIVGVEVNQKDYGGNASTLTEFMSVQSYGALANFNPYREYTRNDGYNTAAFFYSNGYCCGVPRDWFYNGAPYNQPSDFNDRRLDLTFILNQQFNFITTDNVLAVAQTLWNQGRRNTSYYK